MSNNPFESNKKTDWQIAYDQLIDLDVNHSCKADIGKGTLQGVQGRTHPR